MRLRLEISFSPDTLRAIHHLCGGGQPGPGIATQLADILKELKTMTPEMERLTASVAAVKEKDDSIIALVQGLAQQIRDNANDPAALTALADQLDADNQSVVDAVNANTPPAA